MVLRKGARGDQVGFFTNKKRMGGIPRNQRLQSHRSRRTKDPERSSQVSIGSLQWPIKKCS